MMSTNELPPNRIVRINHKKFIPAVSVWLATLILLEITLLPLAYAKEELVDLAYLAPHIRREIRYATKNNFTRTVLYPVARCLLLKPVAENLLQVQKDLEQQGLGLKVFDCYRPPSVQRKLWALLPDPRFVANPAKGSRHSRGVAVDLTLVDHQGQELPMPTDYDEATPQAHRKYQKLPPQILKNRNLLEQAMTKHGFVGLATEWWHFDFNPRGVHFPLLDFPLR